MNSLVPVESEAAALPELDADFVKHQLLPVGDGQNWSGARRWWGGVLDVEGLALAATSLCARAINHLVGSANAASVTAPVVAAAFDSSALLRVAGEVGAGFAKYSGFFRTRDGWIRTHANYPHHERALLDALKLQNAEQIPEALRELDALDAESVLSAAGAIAAAVRTREQWLATEAGSAACTGDWASFELGEAVVDRTWHYSSTAHRPLVGLRVLDFTRVIAGPTASRTLAAWGADVLRVDPPQMPELLGQYIDTGFGKRSTLLNLREREHAKAAHRLAAEADVILLGYRPGALGSLGFSAQELRERYPHLVILELNAWGAQGPWGQRRGFDSIVQAASGISHLYRTAQGAPGALPVQALDHATGYGVAAAAVALVRQRAINGQAGIARFSLARTATELIDQPVPVVLPKTLEAPRLRTISSVYGTLRYATPPFNMYGEPLDYVGPPPAYGKNEPGWLSLA